MLNLQIIFVLFLSFILSGCITLSSTAKVEQNYPPPTLPGVGKLVSELSDNFENPKWRFVRDGNLGKSNNSKWSGSFRGAPKTLTRTKSPKSGLKNESFSLKISTNLTWANDEVSQSDLIFFPDSNVKIRPEHQPSLVARIYVVHPETTTKEVSRFGLRVSATSKNTTYYPSLWLNYKHKNNHSINDKDASKTWYLSIRLGDGISEDVSILEFERPGWYSLGISFDTEGYAHYYFKEGVSDFRLEDRVYSSWQFDSGKNLRMEHITYHFISIGGSKNDLPTPDVLLEHINFYFNSSK